MEQEILLMLYLSFYLYYNQVSHQKMAEIPLWLNSCHGSALFFNLDICVSLCLQCSVLISGLEAAQVFRTDYLQLLIPHQWLYLSHGS